MDTGQINYFGLAIRNVPRNLILDVTKTADDGFKKLTILRELRFLGKFSAFHMTLQEKLFVVIFSGAMVQLPFVYNPIDLLPKLAYCYLLRNKYL